MSHKSQKSPQKSFVYKERTEALRKPVNSTAQTFQLQAVIDAEMKQLREALQAGVIS